MLGSFIYGWLSYVNTFYFFTGFIGVIGFLSILTLPSSLNKDERTDGNQEGQDESEKPDLSYSTVIANKRSLSAVLLMVFAMTAA
jgi:hypothetical protein